MTDKFSKGDEIVIRGLYQGRFTLRTRGEIEGSITATFKEFDKTGQKVTFSAYGDIWEANACQCFAAPKPLEFWIAIRHDDSKVVYTPQTSKLVSLQKSYSCS